MSRAKHVLAGIPRAYVGDLGRGGTIVLTLVAPSLSCWDFLIIISLLIELGLETDATEDDFGVWEVKTMVAVILHLLEGPNGKVLLTICYPFSLRAG